MACNTWEKLQHAQTSSPLAPVAEAGIQAVAGPSKHYEAPASSNRQAVAAVAGPSMKLACKAALLLKLAGSKKNLCAI